MTTNKGPRVVYALCDPRIEDPILCVKYIGMTRNINQRLYGHTICHPNDNPAKTEWVNELTALGMWPPVVVILEHQTDNRSIPMLEIEWMNRYIRMGATLFNRLHSNHTTEMRRMFRANKKAQWMKENPFSQWHYGPSCV